MKWYLLTYYTLIVFGIVVGIFRYKSLAGSSKAILLLLITTLITEVTARFLSGVTSDYFFVYTIFQPIEFTLITVAFHYEIKNRYLIWSIPLYILFAVINGLWIQPVYNTFATYPIIVTILLTSVWALLYLRELLSHPTESSLSDFTLFWFSIGLLLFNAVNIFNYGPFNYINKHLYELVGPAFRAVRIVSNHILYLLILLTQISKQKSIYKP